MVTQAKIARIFVACNNPAALRISFRYDPEANRALRELGCLWIYRWVWGTGVERAGAVIAALENLGYRVERDPAVAA